MRNAEYRGYMYQFVAEDVQVGLQQTSLALGQHHVAGLSVLGWQPVHHIGEQRQVLNVDQQRQVRRFERGNCVQYLLKLGALRRRCDGAGGAKHLVVCAYSSEEWKRS